MKIVVRKYTLEQALEIVPVLLRGVWFEAEPWGADVRIHVKAEAAGDLDTIAKAIGVQA